MTAARSALLLFLLVPATASAVAGAGAARPPIALTASPSHVALAGSARAAVQIANSGSRRVTVDVTRAGFALDLRGRPRIVGVDRPRSAAAWLAFRPRKISVEPGGRASVTVVSRVPPGVEPGDHDALLLITTRPRAREGVAVRMRMGVVVVVRAPGAIRRRLSLGAMHVARAGRRALALELLVANRGNVTEAFRRSSAVLSLYHRNRPISRLTAEPRELRPHTRGILSFRYAGRQRGRMSAHVNIALEGSDRVVRRVFRVRVV
jgi:hypothetical protein